VAVFVTSDTHFGHKNICKGSTVWTGDSYDRARDFPSFLEMDETLFNNINQLVKEDDTLYHLGDFAFGNNSNIINARRRIKCKDVRLIIGNHDWKINKNPDILKMFNFPTKKNVLMPGDHCDRHIIMIHKPDGHISPHYPNEFILHGHSHKTTDLIEGNKMDVGCDGNSLTPYHLEEIIKKLIEST